jgi:uncharacterized iron-regulated membrane protein
MHLWVGATLALVFLAIALSGTIAALRADIIRATVPAARGPAPDPSTFGPALQRLEAAAPGEIRMVKFAPYGLGVHAVSLAGDRGAYIDSQGRVVARWTPNSRFEDWALDFHQTLMAGPIGGQLVGFAGLAGVGMALSGLIIWAPTARGFSLRLWPRSSAPADVLSAHRNIGILVVLLLLLQFTTGAGMVFEDKVQRLLGGREIKTWPTEQVAVRAPDWSAIVAGLQRAYPQARIRTLYGAGKPGDAYMAYLQPRGDVDAKGRVTVFVDGGGRILDVAPPPAPGLGARITHTFFGIHSGDYAGAPSRYLAAASGLGVSLLAVLGAWSFLAKRLRRTVRRRGGPTSITPSEGAEI